MEHVLKTTNPYFSDTWNKFKLFELRLNDRNFKRGDSLVLLEYYPESGIYTGRAILAKIEWVYDTLEGMQAGFVLLAIKLKATLDDKIFVNGMVVAHSQKNKIILEWNLE